MAPRRKVTTKRSGAPKPFVSNPYNQERIAAHHDAVAAAPWLAGMATPEPEAAHSPRLRVLCVLDGIEADHKVLDHFNDEATRLNEEAYWEGSADRRADLFESLNAANNRRVIADRTLAARLASVQIAGLDIASSDEDGPIDDVHGEVKVGGQWAKVADYDHVFLDNETASVRYLAAAAELPPTRVVFVANVEAERWDGEGQRRRQVIPITLTAVLRRIGDLIADRRRQLAMPWGSEPTYPPAPSSDTHG